MPDYVALLKTIPEDNPLKPFSTAALVRELQTRAGVEWTFVEPGEYCQIAVWEDGTVAEPRTAYREGDLYDQDKGPCLLFRIID